MSNFANQHAPQKFDEVIFADVDTRKRLSQYALAQRTKSIILHGPYGTGKSTIARLLIEGRDPASAKFWSIINCSAAEKGFLSPLVGAWRFAPILDVEPICVLEEVDLLPKRLQFDLRAFMDIHGGMFVMTTNYLHAVDKSIQSRCDVIEIAAPEYGQYAPRACQILAEYGIPITIEELESIIADCSNWRDVLGVLEDIVQEWRIRSAE